MVVTVQSGKTNYSFKDTKNNKIHFELNHGRLLIYNNKELIAAYNHWNKVLVA